MLKSKRLLKLSRSGQTAGNGDPDPDDSIEDFIVSRPVKAERKLHKSADTAKHQITSTETFSKADVSNESSEPSSSKSATAVLQSKSPERISPYFEAKTDRDLATLASTSNYPQKVTTRKKTSRKGNSKKADPSDLALALALSESMQMAGENERQKQEELLLTENLVDVIADLRNEDAKSENLAPIFSKSPPKPVPKIKRRGKTDKKTKEFVLAVRTHTERERLIAQQAAAVLNLANDFSKGDRASFFYTEPNSNFLKKYQQRVDTLWERTALVSLEGGMDDVVERFYVTSLRSVLSPQKKSGYTNILFHVSQLPGRRCSQGDHGGVTATQAILEQLAFAAEGGFVEDSNAENQLTPFTPSELMQDWSKMVNNPLMSDVRIKTLDGLIFAHRLVFAVRFPQLLDHLTQSREAQIHELDWSDYSMSSAKKVLLFVYIAEYEHDETIAEEVCHLCRRFNIRALSERIPNHEQYSFLSEEVADEDVLKHEEEMVPNAATITTKENGDSFITAKLDIIGRGDMPMEGYSEVVNREGDSDSEIEELACFLGNNPDKTSLHELSSNTPVKRGIPVGNSLIATTNTKIELDKSKISRESLSPDMFQDSIYDKSCEEFKDPPLDTSEVVDLTQESDKVSSVCSSPRRLRATNFDTNDTEHASIANIRNPENSTSKTEHIMKEDSACEPGSSLFNHDSFLKDFNFVPPSQNWSKSSSHSYIRDKTYINSSSQDLVKSSFLENSFVATSQKAQRDEAPESYLNQSRNSFSTRIIQEPSKNLLKKGLEISPEKSLITSPASNEDEKFIHDSVTEENQIYSAHTSPGKNSNETFSIWEHCNDGMYLAPSCSNPSSPFRSGSHFNSNSPPGNLQNLSKKEIGLGTTFSNRSNEHSDPTPPRASQKSKASHLEDLHTPEVPRPSKKMKTDVTPLPNYHAMDTPGLKKELDKFGLKPMTRKNAVKLLNHIYEELHPFVTDSECSFQDTPERAAVTEASHAQKNVNNSPSKSSLDRSSHEESENTLSEDDESMIATEMDRRNSHSPPRKTQSTISLKEHLKQFFQKRPEVYSLVLTYEPIEFEFLYKEVRKEGIRCKAQELLDWLDEQCITCRMKPRDRTRKPKNVPSGATRQSPVKATKKSTPPQGRRVAKKLIS